MGLFSKKPASGSGLADAVAADVAEAFGRFAADRGDDSIVALALCTVEDAASPYIMGATSDDIGPIEGAEETWRADPADWSWNDEGNEYRYEKIIDGILSDEGRPFEKRAEEVFQGIVDGLKKFTASGKFKAKLPRDQMLLILWINDPDAKHAKSVMKWVGQINPDAVSQWFCEVYPYRS